MMWLCHLEEWSDLLQFLWKSFWAARVPFASQKWILKRGRGSQMASVELLKQRKSWCVLTLFHSLTSRSCFKNLSLFPDRVLWVSEIPEYGSEAGLSWNVLICSVIMGRTGCSSLSHQFFDQSIKRFSSVQTLMFKILLEWRSLKKISHFTTSEFYLTCHKQLTTY